MSKTRRNCKQKNHRRNNPKKKFANFKSKKPGQYQNQNQLLETDVGITQFINTLDGFSAVIKARYSDFQVNEVNLNGEVAKLTDLSIPKDFIKKDSDHVDITLTPTDKIPQETWTEIRKMLEGDGEGTVELDADNLSKQDRTLIHESVKKSFGQKIQASTVTTQGKKMIFKKSNGKSEDHRFKWPADKGEYVHFLVYKESCDTLEACLKIASAIRISPSKITYAGVKDKRGKTTQWFSVRKVEPWKLIVKTRPIPKVKVGNIAFREEPIKLGQLKGNKFRIALRNVMGSDELIQESMKSLQVKGFINYYGLQRFGNNKEVPTFSIGHQLLLGNWKEACDIILKPTDSEDPDFDVAKAKKVFRETGSAEKALKEFDVEMDWCIEYLLLRGLSKEHSNDFVNALENIPRYTRLLYIHSFQSLIWNSAASERVEKFGLEVVEGDLVLLSDFDEEFSIDEEADDTTKKKAQVKVLTAEDCGNYSIYDVVLPLPGYDVVYPENLKRFYKDILEKHGLTLEMTKQKVQTYNLSGTYRKLLAQVSDLKWKITHYNDPNANLIRSDLEELRNHPEPEDIPDGKYKALVMEFFLKSSSYATMVLREILKTDTSSSSHAKLNDYHVEKGTQEGKNDAQLKNDAEVPVEDFSDRTGLLADAEKYEKFKNLVFGVEEEQERKRPLEEGEHSGSSEAKNRKTVQDE